MAKISFSNLKLQIVNENKTFTINNQEIEVRQYLPIEQKNDLIYITLQKSLENNVYNPVKMDMFFHLNLVYLYTNLNITDKQKEDEYKLYDILSSNGIINKTIELIPESEYQMLFEYLGTLQKSIRKYQTSFAGVVGNLISDLPAQAQAAADIVNNFDPTKFQEVVEFAKMANGGRALK